MKITSGKCASWQHGISIPVQAPEMQFFVPVWTMQSHMGAKRLVLISCTGLKAAIHLYRKNVFHEVPYRKGYWKSEKTDIEMEKTITS